MPKQTVWQRKIIVTVAVNGHFHYGCAALRFAAIVSDSER